MSKIIYNLNIANILLFYLLKSILCEKIEKITQKEIIYPSVLSLYNGGLVVIQNDGIHFFDSNKTEENTKKIIFEIPISSKIESEKISMSQFPKEEGGYILILINDKIYIFKRDGIILEILNIKEMNDVKDVKLIPYKKEKNNLLYIISYKKPNSKKRFAFNFYKFDINKKNNLLIMTKSIESIKDKTNLQSREILGESCLFMKNTQIDENILSCFFGIGFPSEIQVKTFSINNEIIKEKNNYKYLIGNYGIENFNLISTIANSEKDQVIVYYIKNNNLSEIKFDFIKGFYDSIIVSPDADLSDEFWEKESEKMNESKESIFSSRLYRAYCKSYMIFFNSNFTQLNTGFISHDNKCATLLSYSKFFRDNKYSLTINNINNNKILIKKRRKLARSLGSVTVPEKCNQTIDVGYTEESITFNLCKECNTADGYYPVWDPNNTLYNHGKGFVQCFNENNKKNFYLNTDRNRYEPCYETCASCNELGNAFNHKCEKCDLKYKFVENDDPNLKICEAECPFADYEEKFLGYYQCTRTNSCPEAAPYLLDTEELKRCYEDCDETEYKWSYAGRCYLNCTEANAIIDSEADKTCKDPEPTVGQRCFVTYNSIKSNNFMTASGVHTNAQTYAKDFSDTTTHINYYNNSNAIMVIFKDQSCIKELKLQVPNVNFADCLDKIVTNMTITKPGFNKDTDLIIALVGGNTSSSGVETTYSFFYKNGDYINASEICQGIKIETTTGIGRENVDDDAEKIAAQGINIFDLDDPFYTDICFMYDSPTGRDATPNDRVATYYPNVSLCDEAAGCEPKSIDLDSFEVICDCKFNDLMSNPKVGEKILEDSFGEIIEMIENSNIMIFKCAKDVFVIKHIIKNIGTYITLGIMLVQIICVVIYYLFSYNPMLRYLYYLSEYQCSSIEMKLQNKEAKKKQSLLNTKLIKIQAPPKKEEKIGLKTPSANKLISSEESSNPKKLDITGNSNSNLNSNKAHKLKNENEKELLKKEKENKKEKKPMYADKLKEEYDIEMEEYLKTDFDDMEFEDALKRDTRTFCEYYFDKFKERQIIMDTFFNPEMLKPLPIKVIILFLNIIFYFVINGLFFSEEYVSELFNSDEEEKFFSFFPRSITRFIYTTIVSGIISIILDFIAVDEQKVKRLFLREKKNTLQIRYEISQITADIKKNYLILIIICVVIDLISFYYVNCFNNVYPNLRDEWIKSSICIIIIMQILSMLTGLLEALIRLIAFKCKSERVYKIKDLLD